MQFVQIDREYIVRLDRGEELVATVNSLCENEAIYNASLLGIGSIENLELAHYRVDDKRYTVKRFKGVFEVLFVGNVGIIEGKPIAHIHAVISDEQMRSSAGHLVRATVSATCEITIVKLSSRYHKQHNQKIGLKLWNFEGKPDK